VRGAAVRGARGWVALLALFIAGCATIPGSTEPASIPAERTRPAITPELRARLNRLRPAEDWPGAFVIQHRVRIRFPAPDGAREEAFDAALQREGRALLLLGFGPMQRVGFVLRLEDGAVTFTNRTGREMPFRPEDILADVQRVYFPWSGQDEHGMRVDERRSDGVLVTRTFGAVDHPELGEVEIEYSGEPFFRDVPARVLVRNGWFGYELSIENQRVELLD